MDRDGDVWRVGGRTRTGEELLVCDSPQHLDDQGPEGLMLFPWTRAAVENWFGPLVRIEVPRLVEPTSLVLRDGTVLTRAVAA
ncbi:hypothetical protein [Streptomyces sp. NPDC020983]|uniref:hypothetical protein n=1 Tax=Streptomyces sp. NPDC020983 TaxID=3365106 RepID=UPI0037B32E9A